MPLLRFTQNTRDARLGRSARLLALTLLSLFLLTWAPKASAAEIDDAKAFVSDNTLLKALGTNFAGGLTGQNGRYSATVGGVTVHIVSTGSRRTVQWVAIATSASLKSTLESKLGGNVDPAILIANKSGSSSSLQNFFPSQGSLTWIAGANVYGNISTDGPLKELTAVGLLPSGSAKFRGNFNVGLFKQLLDATAPSADWDASLQITAGAWNNSSLPLTAGGSTATISMHGGNTSSSTVSGALTSVKVRGVPGTLKSASIQLTAGTEPTIRIGLDGIFGPEVPLRELVFVYTGGIAPTSSLTSSWSVDGHNFDVVGALDGDTVRFTALLKERWVSPFGIPKATLNANSSLSFAVGTAALDIGFDGGLVIDGVSQAGSVCGKFGAAGLIGLGFDFPIGQLSASDTLAMVGKIAEKSKASGSFVNWTSDASKVPLPALSGAHVALHTAGLQCSQYADKQGVGGTVAGTGTFDQYLLGEVDLTFALNGDASDGFRLVGSTPSLKLGSDVIAVSALNFLADVPLTPSAEKLLDGKVKFSGKAAIGTATGIDLSGALGSSGADFSFSSNLLGSTATFTGSASRTATSLRVSGEVSDTGQSLTTLKSFLTAGAAKRQPSRRIAFLKLNNARRTFEGARDEFVRNAASVCSRFGVTDCGQYVLTASNELLRGIQGFSNWIQTAETFANAINNYASPANIYAIWNKILEGLTNSLTIHKVAMSGTITSSRATYNAAVDFTLLESRRSATFSVSSDLSQLVAPTGESFEISLESPPPSPPPKPQLKGVASTMTITQRIEEDGYYPTSSNPRVARRRKVITVKVSAAGYAPLCEGDATNPSGLVKFYRSRENTSLSAAAIENGEGGDASWEEIGSANLSDDGIAKFNTWNKDKDSYPNRLGGVMGPTGDPLVFEPRLEDVLFGKWTIHAVYQGGPTSCSGSTPDQQNPGANWGYRYSVGSTTWLHTAPESAVHTLNRPDVVAEFTLGPPSSSWGGDRQRPWEQAYFCPVGTYAVSFNEQIEPKQAGSGDDSALNIVQLVCRDKAHRQNTVVANPFWGHWGDWFSATRSGNGLEPFCPTGQFLKGAHLWTFGYETNDAFGATMASFQCSDYEGTTMKTKSNASTTLGGHPEPDSCPGDTVICGISTDLQPKQGSSKNDTAMNAMRIQCCSMPK